MLNLYNEAKLENVHTNSKDFLVFNEKALCNGQFPTTELNCPVFGASVYIAKPSPALNVL